MNNKSLPLILAILAHGYLYADVSFDWVTVGNPNNPADQVYPINNPDNVGFGSVPYSYRITKYEVTNEQYTEFLNAIDAAGANPNGVYRPTMGSHVRGGIMFTAGGAPGAKYSTKIDMANKPVNFVSFFDVMRFANWLENDQPTDGSGTESGVYTLGNGINETRNPDARFFIPNENEWYKAAHHHPADQGGDSDDYWEYPTGSNSAPTLATANSIGDISNPGTNVANYLRGADWNGQNGNVTTVGSAGPESASFYGTFDQGGNLYEWNESVITLGGVPFRGIRGGGWLFAGVGAPSRTIGAPQDEVWDYGFRVASVDLRCDFSGDATCDVTDLDLLLSLGPLASGVTAQGNETFDLNGDGTLGVADRDVWLELAATENGFGSPYSLADANLDGVVDAQDFIAWNANRFTSDLKWSTGNFNADEIIDGQDFILWNDNKFTSLDGLNAVPEPVTQALWIAVMILGFVRRTSNSTVEA